MSTPGWRVAGVMLVLIGLIIIVGLFGPGGPDDD